jgi:hypothetical protein
MINKMKKITKVLFALTAFCFLSPVYALDGESIVFNPTTGNYLITYLSSSDDQFHQVTFIPATKIKPTLKSRLTLERNGVIHYGYLLISGRDSQQVIVNIGLNSVSSIHTDLPSIPLNAPAGTTRAAMSSTEDSFDTPVPWKPVLAYSDDRFSFRVGWYYGSDTSGLPPGGKADFGFKSLDLPGIIRAEISGYAFDSEEIPGEETQDADDGGFGQQYSALISNNFVPRYAAVPTIIAPSPFNAAVLLGSIQTQMHTWIGMQLLDATFSSQLDRYLTAAADAYRHNQPKVVKEDIEKIREMLKREHQDLGRDEEHESDNSREKNDDRKSRMIDRLAAQVLDFDLKYVLKRMDKDHDSD